MTKCDQDKLILFVVPWDLPEQQNKSSIDICRGILSDLGKLVSSHDIPDDVVQISSIPFTAHGKYIINFNEIFYISSCILKCDVLICCEVLFKFWLSDWNSVLNDAK